MPANRIDLPVKHSAESYNVLFNFISQLAGTETISTSNAAQVVYSGNDVGPTLTLSNFSLGSVVTVTVGAGTPGVIYEVTVSATSNVGNIYIQRALLAVAPNPE